MDNLLVTLGLPALLLGALGAFFGIFLYIVDKKLHVPVDEKTAALRAALPGANCGGCGRPGCDGFAEALANGTAKPTECPVSNQQQIAQLCQLLGIQPESAQRMTAFINCTGGHDTAQFHFMYEGLRDCASAGALQGGFKVCKHGCLGLGSCVAACPFKAIRITPQGVSEVDREKCRGCKRCVSACPRGIVHMVPYTQHVRLACNTKLRGKAVRDGCKAGCIGCALCQRTCPQGAITMEDNLPVIDFDRCTLCGACASKCPTGALKNFAVQPNTES